MADELLSPPRPTTPFVGREKELEWLEREVFDRERRFAQMPLVIVGPPGVGKTALAAEFVAQRSRSERVVWLQCRRLGKDGSAFSPIMDGGLRGRQSREIIAVLDGADEISSDRFQRLFFEVANFKAVRNLIITSRTQLELRGERVLQLKGLSEEESRRLITNLSHSTVSDLSMRRILNVAQGHPLALSIVSGLARSLDQEQLDRVLAGHLYDLNDETPPEKDHLITLARPVIITANEAVIAALQKHPDDIFKLSSRQYEELIAELIRDMGYDVTLTQATRDGGKDILASIKTEFGDFLCLVEAKRYREDRKIGVGLVRQLYGTLCDYQANSAMLVTTSTFSKDAHDLQQKHKYQLSLRDYTDVAGWIQKYGTSKLKRP